MSVCMSFANSFFIHISCITRLDKFLEVPAHNLWSYVMRGVGEGVTFLELATQNMMYGHMKWRGVKIIYDIRGVYTIHRQDIDKP